MTPLNPIMYPRIDLFLLGFIVACSFLSALFFLRFWKATHDALFMAFSVFFLIQGISYSAATGSIHPNEVNLWVFLLRLLSVLGILSAILWKNRKAS